MTPISMYVSVLRDALGSPVPFRTSAESATRVQVERGLVLAHAVSGRGYRRTAGEYVDRLLTEMPGGLTVVDGLGHIRPVYGPLLVYAWVSSHRIMADTLPPDESARWRAALHWWFDRLQGGLIESNLATGPLPASRGADLAEAMFSALALHVGGTLFNHYAWTVLASTVFKRLRTGQLPNGAFLTPSRSDNPETLWYHELLLLHAAAAYAVQARDDRMTEAVRRNADYHLNETQPDHATNQPWGLLGFMLTPDATPLVDQVLHTTLTLNPGGVSGISAVLLADVLMNLEAAS